MACLLRLRKRLKSISSDKYFFLMDASTHFVLRVLQLQQLISKWHVACSGLRGDSMSSDDLHTLHYTKKKESQKGLVYFEGSALKRCKLTSLRFSFFLALVDPS